MIKAKSANEVMADLLTKRKAYEKHKTELRKIAGELQVREAVAQLYLERKLAEQKAIRIKIIKAILLTMVAIVVYLIIRR